MYIKEGILFFVLIAGSWAFPAPEAEQDMSIFFEHVSPGARIVGGTQAPAGSHPHMGAMSNGAFIRSFVCGSSIITRRTVLTAAHCIVAVLSGNSLSSSLRVTVGTNRWNSGGQMYAFQRHVNHASYDANNIKNDIGVLITSANIIMSNVVGAVPLNYDWVGDRVSSRVAGWGRIRAGGALSVNLLQLNVNTIDGDRCIRDVRDVAASINRRAPPVNPQLEICTFHSHNHGTCNGDSGSALLRTDRGQQIGIVSWGLPCALGAPDMFVRVSAYRNWIQTNTVS